MHAAHVRDAGLLLVQMMPHAIGEAASHAWMRWYRGGLLGPSGGKHEGPARPCTGHMPIEQIAMSWTATHGMVGDLRGTHDALALGGAQLWLCRLGQGDEGSLQRGRQAGCRPAGLVSLAHSCRLCCSLLCLWRHAEHTGCRIAAGRFGMMCTRMLLRMRATAASPQNAAILEFSRNARIWLLQKWKPPDLDCHGRCKTCFQSFTMSHAARHCVRLMTPEQHSYRFDLLLLCGLRRST